MSAWQTIQGATAIHIDIFESHEEIMLDFLNPPKVSIIVPVFNAEIYIHRCVNSLLNQTFKDIEILLVNDGSSDNCPAICDDYAMKDSRVKVVHKDNGGVSDARNAGIQSARGTFIIFVDCDDWCERNYVDRMYNACASNQKAVAVSSYSIIYEDDNYVAMNHITSRYEQVLETADGIIALDRLGAFNLAWNKIYIKSLIKDNSLQFKKDGMPAEDLFFNCEYFRLIEYVILIGDSLYNYRSNNQESLVTRHYPNLYNMVCGVLHTKRNLYEHYDLLAGSNMQIFMKIYIFYMFSCIPNLFRKTAGITNREKRELFKKLIENEELQQYLSVYESKDILIWSFKKLMKLKSVAMMHFVYGLLFEIRYSFYGFYKYLRKRRISTVKKVFDQR